MASQRMVIYGQDERFVVRGDTNGLVEFVLEQADPFVCLEAFVSDLVNVAYYEDGTMEMIPKPTIAAPEKRTFRAPDAIVESHRDLLLLMHNPFGSETLTPRVKIAGGAGGIQLDEQCQSVCWMQDVPTPELKANDGRKLRTAHMMNPYQYRRRLDSVLGGVKMVTYYENQVAKLTYYPRPGESHDVSTVLIPTEPQQSNMLVTILLLNNFGNWNCVGTVTRQVTPAATATATGPGVKRPYESDTATTAGTGTGTGTSPGLASGSAHTVEGRAHGRGLGMGMGMGPAKAKARVAADSDFGHSLSPERQQILWDEYGAMVHQSRRAITNGEYADAKNLDKLIQRNLKLRIEKERGRILSEHELAFLAYVTLVEGADEELERAARAKATAKAKIGDGIGVGSGVGGDDGESSVASAVRSAVGAGAARRRVSLVDRVNMSILGEPSWSLRTNYFMSVRDPLKSQIDTYFEEFTKTHPTFTYYLGFAKGQDGPVICFDKKAIAEIRGELKAKFGHDFGPRSGGKIPVQKIHAALGFQCGDDRIGYSFSQLQSDEKRRQNVRTLKRGDLDQVRLKGKVLMRARELLAKRRRIVAVSMERWTKDHSVLLEVGLSVWPVTVPETGGTDVDVDMQMDMYTRTFHWVVCENWRPDRHNSYSDQTRYRKFRFGEPEKLTQANVVGLLKHFCGQADAVTGHEIATLALYLKTLGVDVTDKCIDLQDVAVAATGVCDQQSLPSLMKQAGRTEKTPSGDDVDMACHIAGNDARYALDVLMKMCE